MMNKQNSGLHLSKSAFLFFIPPFLLLGSFLPQTRFFWVAVPLSAIIAFFSVCLSRRFLLRDGMGKNVFLFLLSLFFFIMIIWGISRFLKGQVIQNSPVWLFPACLLLFLFSSSLALKDEKFLFRLASISSPLILVLLVISAAATFRKVELFFLPSAEYWFPSQNIQGFLFSVFACTLLWISISMMLLNIENLEFSAADFGKMLCVSALILSVLFFSAVLALGPNLTEALPYPWYSAPGLDRRAGYLDRQELFSCAALILSLPPYLLLLLNQILKPLKLSKFQQKKPFIFLKINNRHSGGNPL